MNTALVPLSPKSQRNIVKLVVRVLRENAMEAAVRAADTTRPPLGSFPREDARDCLQRALLDELVRDLRADASPILVAVASEVAYQWTRHAYNDGAFEFEWDTPDWMEKFRRIARFARPLRCQPPTQPVHFLPLEWPLLFWDGRPPQKPTSDPFTNAHARANEQLAAALPPLRAKAEPLAELIDAAIDPRHQPDWLAGDGSEEHVNEVLRRFHERELARAVPAAEPTTSSRTRARP